MKIFTSSQIAEIDKFTIKHEPISEADLIRRVARKIYEWLKPIIKKGQQICIFAGPGNNGSDAIALATYLAARDYNCKLFLIKGRDVKSDLRRELLNELYVFGYVEVKEIESEEDVPVIPANSLVVEGIFGTGLNRCAEGFFCNVINSINNSGAKVVSIDLPSGLFSEENPQP